MLSPDEMIQRSKLKERIVEECPEWGAVRLRQLPLAKLGKMEVKFPPSEAQMADLIVDSVINEQGEYQFTDEHRAVLVNLNPLLAMKLWNEILELNTISDKRIDEEIKN